MEDMLLLPPVLVAKIQQYQDKKKAKVMNFVCGNTSSK